MKLAALLALPATLTSTLLASAAPLPEYSEHLDLQPLPSNALYAGFTFTSTTPLAAYRAQHFRHFPRSLAQILHYTHTEELHLRFALGRWDDERWGARPREGLREGGNGVELWAWIEDGAGEEEGVEERWGGLVNSLSGLFCASLNFVDEGKTVRPVGAFEAEGDLEVLRRGNGTEGGLELLHGMLPHEVVCTENLTPFVKLLPCKGKAGIGSLLDGHKVFDASWQTMSVDVRPVCEEGAECVIEIQQTVDMVLDIARSMRPMDNPIPRPPAVNELACDEGKPYNAPDTCYPKPLSGEAAWTLSAVFGRPIQGSCPLSPSEDAWDITVSVPYERTVQPISDEHVPAKSSEDELSRSFRLPEGSEFDLYLPQQELSEIANLPLPPLFASRQINGYGQERGGMKAHLRNPHPYPQRIMYLESLPWFLRPYMHTLHLSGGHLEKMFYTPLADRERGTHLEMLIEIPAESTVELSYDFEKAILRYTEYPPDANRGFDVAPAIIRVLPSEHTPESIGKQGSYLRTTSLLLPLPTPDFSMPYNVIILTSTVIALGFGSVFNLLVRRFVLAEEVGVSPLAKVVGRVKEVVAKVKAQGKPQGVPNGQPNGDPPKEKAKAKDR